MKKLFYAFSALALLLASCSSDSDSTSEVPSGLPSRMVETYMLDGNVDQVITSDFIFTGNKLMTINYDGDGSGYRETFTYTGDLITRMQVFENNLLIEEQIFTYDSQERLVTHKTLGDEGQFQNKYTFVYNADGTITRNYYFLNEEEIDGITKFYLTDGEITTIEHLNTISGTVSENNTETITYDAKHNPFKNITGYTKAFSMVDFDSGYGGFQRNLLTNDTPVGEFDHHWNFEYVYNSADYPTHITKTFNESEILEVELTY